MIIVCPCEKKQFKIDRSLIPYEGRELQCGSCKITWFYKPENKNESQLTLNDKTFINEVEQGKETKAKNFKHSTNLIEDKIIEGGTKKENLQTVKKSKEKKSKLFSYLVVFIISFAALIILLDTLKNPLINIFPGLEIIIFNLFETLKDIKLFIIDLI